MIAHSTRRPRGLAALALWAVAAVLVAGCASSGGSKTQSTTAAATGAAKAEGGAVAEAPAKEPEHITVQHILIGAAGTVPGKDIKRTMEEAKQLAYEIADRARKGEPFDGLVRQYTDDQWPGTYGMSNKGVAPAQGEYPREGMVPAFGNVGFKLAVGDIGVADFDPQTSPYGYHVIKRVK
jgi:hypothetical protein